MENPLWVSLVYCWPGPPSGLATGCCFVPSLSAELTLYTLYTPRPNVTVIFSVYIRYTDIQPVKRTSYSWEQAVYFSAYLGSSHCLSRLEAWYWLRHALSGSRRPDTGTDVFSDNTQRLRTTKMRKPGVLLYKKFSTFPSQGDPQSEAMDWI